MSLPSPEVRCILGIDPGSRRTGYGLIQAKGRKVAYISSGCIVAVEGDMPKRLTTIYKGLQTIIQEFQPDEAAIEDLFLAKDPSAALKLGQARGVAIAAVANHDLAVYEYTPRSVKKALVGTGGADKTQVAYMVKTLLQLPGLPQADAADALAIALCHVNTSQH